MATTEYDASSQNFSADVASIERIQAVPTILDVVCKTTGMGFAAVARVTDDRWIACSVRDDIAFGLAPGGELKVETTICSEVRERRAPIIISNVAEDPQYSRHPTPAMYGFQSYVSMPIVLPDGTFFGTLCAIDPRPARLEDPSVIGMFHMFADLIAFHLDAQSRLDRSEANLLDERKTAELREQFIAVLGHDLRNPLASIQSGARLLGGDLPREKSDAILGMMQSSVGRMASLIDNVLDLARGRLGGGLTLQRRVIALQPVLDQVIGELRSSNPSRRIEVTADLARPVDCDGTRMSQIFSNLIGNALTHGAIDAPIAVRATSGAELFELSVANSGDEIPAAAISRLFQPFERGAVRADKQGLGLGLYIAAQIAEAHGGTLSVESSPDRTCFTFRMPMIGHQE